MSEMVRHEPSPSFSLVPRNFAEAKEYAALIANSDFAPKDYRGKPGNVIVAVQMGAALGLQPLQALQNIAVINGRPSVWGDALLAICQSRPDFEDITELVDGEGDERVAICTIRRRGRSPIVRQFSVADAKKAGLWGKQGPWQNYPERMLQMRARGFALRDAYADALLGLITTEEAQDIPNERHMGEAKVVTPQAAPPKPSRTEQAKAAMGSKPAEVVDATTGEVQPAPDGPIEMHVVLARIASAATVDELVATGTWSKGFAFDDAGKAQINEAYRARREVLRKTEPAEPGEAG
jgi:hypothetical protein